MSSLKRAKGTTFAKLIQKDRAWAFFFFLAWRGIYINVITLDDLTG